MQYFTADAAVSAFGQTRGGIEELDFVDQLEINELADRIVMAYWDDLPNAERVCYDQYS